MNRKQLGRVQNQSFNNNSWVERILSADVTSDGAMSDLTVGNLKVGQTYLYILHPKFQASTDVLVQIDVTHNGVIIDRSTQRQDGTDITGITPGITGFFTAVALDITFVANSAAAAGIIQGNGTKSETWIQVVAMPGFIQVQGF